MLFAILLLFFVLLGLFVLRLKGEDLFLYLPPSKLSIEQVTIPVKGLPSHLNGMRIAQISDIHYSERLDNTYLKMLQQAVQDANSYDPHLAVVTGDLVDHRYSDNILDGLSNLLSNLRARNGRYISLGNHDYSMDGKHQANKIKSALEAKGLKVLINASAYPFQQTIAINDTMPENNNVISKNMNLSVTDGLAVVGLGDVWGGDFHPEEVFPFISADTPRLVLSHNPDTATQLSWWRADVILSGHTHGGQICLPSLQPNRGYPLLRIFKAISQYLPVWMSRYIPGHYHWNAIRNWQWAQGLHQVPRSKQGIGAPLLRDPIREYDSLHNSLYVNRGLYSIYKRLFCSPELTIITLVSM